MSNYTLNGYEKETIILWNEEDDTVRISTYNPGHIRRLAKRAEEYPEGYHLDETDAYGGVSYTVQKSLLRVSYVLPLTEEERANRSRRARENNLVSYLHQPSGQR